MLRNLAMKFARFMQGRNGPDSLYNFLMVVILIVLVLNLFINSIILSLLYFALFIYCIFRVLSKNIYKRRAENAKFLKMRSRVTSFFSFRKKMWQERKTHIYKKCPKCKKRLRLPRKPGAHTVKCPLCGERFDIKVR